MKTNTITKENLKRFAKKKRKVRGIAKNNHSSYICINSPKKAKDTTYSPHVSAYNL
jgi:hypothetical protein